MNYWPLLDVAVIVVGFIHIPCLPARAARLHGTASMAQAEVERGLLIALRVAAATNLDRSRVGGSID